MFNIDHKFDFGAVASKLSVCDVFHTRTPTQKSNLKIKIYQHIHFYHIK